MLCFKPSAENNPEPSPGPAALRVVSPAPPGPATSPPCAPGTPPSLRPEHRHSLLGASAERWPSPALGTAAPAAPALATSPEASHVTLSQSPCVLLGCSEHASKQSRLLFFCESNYLFCVASRERKFFHSWASPAPFSPPFPTTVRGQMNESLFPHW